MKAGVTDQSLLEAVSEMEAGLVEARLGGSLFKKRLARPGSGKSKSFRVITAGAPDLRALKQIAAVLLTMAPNQIERALKTGDLVELRNG